MKLQELVEEKKENMEGEEENKQHSSSELVTDSEDLPNNEIKKGIVEDYKTSEETEY